MRKEKERAIAAAEALSDMNTFSLVASILEGGHVHSPSYRAAARIIKICNTEAQKRLRDYDKALAPLGA